SWERIPVQIAVFCQNVQGQDELCWSARATDISRGGIRLLSPHKFEPAMVVRIGRANGAEESLRLVEALVVRAERPPAKNGPWAVLSPRNWAKQICSLGLTKPRDSDPTFR